MMIRVAMSLWSPLRSSELGLLTVVNDETGSQAIGFYDITFDDFPRRRQIKTRVEFFPREERNALELIAEAIKQVVEAEAKEAVRL